MKAHAPHGAHEAFLRRVRTICDLTEEVAVTVAAKWEAGSRHP
jgi:hypothetical protein